MVLNVSHESVFLEPGRFNVCRKDVPYSDTRERTFFGHFHPARLSVPRFVQASRVLRKPR